MCQFNTTIDKNIGLIEFLKEKGVYDQFTRNTLSLNKYGHGILKTFEVNPEVVGIDGAFPWNLSPEGRVYWENIEKEYKNLTKPTDDLQD